MPVNYDHTRTSASREAFLLSEPFSEDSVRPEVLASWKRCKDGGLPADAPAIPCLPQPGARGAEIIPAAVSGSRKVFLNAIFDEFTACLDKIGAMFMGMQTNLAQFIHRGNSALIQELAEKGVLSCVNFQEQHAGTNAAALVKKNRNEAWCVGAEHYLSCLEKYATYAYYANEHYSRYILLVILPRGLFTDSFIAMLRYFRQVQSLTVELHQKDLALSMQVELFNQLKKVRDEALILVDFSQKIINVNKRFEVWFDLTQDDVLHHDLTEILPELDVSVSCLGNGKDIRMQEVHFEGLSRGLGAMYMNCTPWEHNGIINGMVISLTDARRLVAPAAGKSGAAGRGYVFEDLVGDSPVFREVKRHAAIVARGGSSIILTGESGTGKELFAQAIHAASFRAQQPFVAVNCGAIPKELIESELFGYGDGAFTGARKGGAMGKFEYANGGTLFLDELAELPLEVQAKLLRVLEDKSVVRIGTNKVVPVNVRIISATNKNLLQLVNENKFRLDLYYRLNVINLELPPLRVRQGDIQLLAAHFLDEIGRQLNKTITAVAPDAMRCLQRHDWPGNIRQLRNVLERGVNMADSDVLQLRDLPREITEPGRPAEQSHPAPEAAAPAPGGGNYEEWERRLIWEAMQKHRGNKSKIAEELNMSRGTLYKKMQKYGF